ncbi:VIP2 protein [Mycobacterium phage Gumball]|nr:gp6 [Mycobacterium phage Gumball]ACI06380.1 VIP2 protein [Mycobacterium phage Gumball]
MPKKKVTGAKLKWGSAAQKRAQRKAAEASARKRRKRGLQDILKRKRRAAGSFSEVRKSSVKVAREHDLSGTGHGANKEAYRASAAESRKIKAAGGTSSADRVYSTARKLKYTAPRGKAGNQGKVGLSSRSKGSGSSSDKFKQGDTVYADGKSWTIRSFREANGNTYVDAKADNGTDLSLVIKGTGLDKKTIRTALGDRSRSESKTVKPGDSAAAHRAKSFSQNARGVSMGGRGSSSRAPKDMSSMSDRDLQNAILNARTAADKKAYSNELAKRNLDKHFPKGIKNASTEELQNKVKDGTTPSSVKTAIDAELDRRAKAKAPAKARGGRRPEKPIAQVMKPPKDAVPLVDKNGNPTPEAIRRYGNGKKESGYPDADDRAAWNKLVGRDTYRDLRDDMTPRQRANYRKELQRKLDNPRISDSVKKQARDEMALLDALDKGSGSGSANSGDARAQRVLDLHDHELQDLASEMGRLDLYKRDLKGEGHFDRKPSEISKEERVRNAIQGLMRYVEEDLGYEVDWDEQRLDNALNNDPRMKKLRAILAKLGKMTGPTESRSANRTEIKGKSSDDVDTAIDDLKAAQDSNKSDAKAKVALERIRHYDSPADFKPPRSAQDHKRQSLASYRDVSSAINGSLRSGENISRNAWKRGVVEDLDSMISESTLKRPITVRRFIGQSAGGSGIRGDYARVKKQLESGTFKDKGFMSTEAVTPGYSVGQMGRLWSDRGKPGENDFVLEMDLPKGFNALDLRMEDLNDNHLSEILLPRNTEWEVTGTRTEDGITVYKLRPSTKPTYDEVPSKRRKKS